MKHTLFKWMIALVMAVSTGMAPVMAEGEGDGNPNGDDTEITETQGEEVNHTFTVSSSSNDDGTTVYSLTFSDMDFGSLSETDTVNIKFASEDYNGEGTIQGGTFDEDTITYTFNVENVSAYVPAGNYQLNISIISNGTTYNYSSDNAWNVMVDIGSQNTDDPGNESGSEDNTNTDELQAPTITSVTLTKPYELNAIVNLSDLTGSAYAVIVWDNEQKSVVAFDYKEISDNNSLALSLHDYGKTYTIYAFAASSYVVFSNNWQIFWSEGPNAKLDGLSNVSVPYTFTTPDRDTVDQYAKESGLIDKINALQAPVIKNVTLDEDNTATVTFEESDDNAYYNVILFYDNGFRSSSGPVSANGGTGTATFNYLQGRTKYDVIVYTTLNNNDEESVFARQLGIRDIYSGKRDSDYMKESDPYTLNVPATKVGTGTISANEEDGSFDIQCDYSNWTNMSGADLIFFRTQNYLNEYLNDEDNTSGNFVTSFTINAKWDGGKYTLTKNEYMHVPYEILDGEYYVAAKIWFNSGKQVKFNLSANGSTHFYDNRIAIPEKVSFAFDEDGFTVSAPVSDSDAVDYVNAVYNGFANFNGEINGATPDITISYNSSQNFLTFPDSNNEKYSNPFKNGPVTSGDTVTLSIPASEIEEFTGVAIEQSTDIRIDVLPYQRKVEEWAKAPVGGCTIVNVSPDQTGNDFEITCSGNIIAEIPAGDNLFIKIDRDNVSSIKMTKKPIADTDSYKLTFGNDELVASSLPYYISKGSHKVLFSHSPDAGPKDFFDLGEVEFGMDIRKKVDKSQIRAWTEADPNDINGDTDIVMAMYAKW